MLLSANGKWKETVDERVRKGTRALYAMLTNLHQFGTLPAKFLLNLFDKKIAPVLLYGCEMWGLDGINEINSVIDQFYRNLLGLRPNALITLARGEL